MTLYRHKLTFPKIDNSEQDVLNRALADLDKSGVNTISSTSLEFTADKRFTHAIVTALATVTQGRIVMKPGSVSVTVEVDGVTQSTQLKDGLVLTLRSTSWTKY